MHGKSSGLLQNLQLMRLYTLTSDMHGELARNAHNEPFIKDIEAALGEPFECLEGDFSSFGIPGDIIYVRTGGTEGNFRRVYAGHVGMPVRMLTSGKSNSLAASMEIMSWLRDRGIPGEIIRKLIILVRIEFYDVNLRAITRD